MILIFCRSIIQSYFGCLDTAYLYEKDITFQIIYGMKGYNSNDERNNANDGLLSASDIMNEIKRIFNIKTILIGVSTGNLSQPVKFSTFNECFIT